MQFSGIIISPEGCINENSGQSSSSWVRESWSQRVLVLCVREARTSFFKVEIGMGGLPKDSVASGAVRFSVDVNVQE
jgi:hypothetical protein